MPRATLINDREWERDYITPTGRMITLKLDEDLSQVTFWDGGNQLGNDRDFLFVESEGDNNSYLLARMYSPIVRSGLGRASLEFFKEITGAKIYTRPNDGIVRDDSTHLTGDAPIFVGKMIKEGLIENNDIDDLTHEVEF